MKKLFLVVTCAMLAVGASTKVNAQSKPKDKTDKTKVKTDNDNLKSDGNDDKLGDYDEIVIKKKGDKGGKVTVEIKGDDVIVNGKPLSDYDDDNISVRKNRVTVWNGNSRALIAPASPFRYNVSGNRTFLGVTTDEDDKGARITDVTENSAAAKAGLKEGDIITKIDDTKIENQSQLSKVVTGHKPEDKVTIVYLRDGKEQKTVATLGKNTYSGSYNYAMPRMAPMPDMHFDNDMNFNFDNGGMMFNSPGRGRIGIKAQDTEDGKGVKVIDINDESLADKAGLKEGDVITEFDGKTVNSADELAQAAREAREKNSISIKYNRDGKPQTAEIKVPKKLKTTNL
jgi:serine protease Do